MSDFRKHITQELGIFFGVALIFGIALFILGSDMSGRVRDIAQQREEFSTRSRALESLALLRSDDAKAGPYLSILENTLPTKDQLIVFANDLKAMAKNRQLGFGFTFGGEVAPTSAAPGISNFRLSATGSYGALTQFFNDIKSNRYLVKFIDLDISQKGNTYEAALNGQVFYR